jgi:glutamyl-tRNA synthetase
MQITHVFRGDDHVNNTPRQINIFRALGAALPQFGTCARARRDGQKLSQAPWRQAVTAYEDERLPARSDGELPGAPGLEPRRRRDLQREQFLQWFDGSHLGKSAAQWDEAKLRWVNAQHMKAKPTRTRAARCSRSCKSAASSPTKAPARNLRRCSRTAATPRRHWPTGPRRFYSDIEVSDDEVASTSPMRCGPRSHAGQDADCPWDKAHQSRHQGSAARHTAEDAATGHASASACDGNGADAVAGCSPRNVFPRKSYRAIEKGLKFLAII